MPAFIAAAALKLSPVGRFLKAIPWQVWAAIGLALALWLGVRWYDGQITAAERRGAAAEGQRLAAKAIALKNSIDALTGRISTVLKERNNEDARRIAAGYDALRLRGAGKAACPGYASLSRGPGGQQTPAGSGDAAVAGMPGGERIDLIALPVAPTFTFGEQHDRCRSDLLSYREWEKQVLEAWPK